MRATPGEVKSADHHVNLRGGIKLISVRPRTYIDLHHETHDIIIRDHCLMLPREAEVA